MADQDNFEDELFADLYADDEPVKPAATEQPKETPAAAPSADLSTNLADTSAQADYSHDNGDNSYTNHQDDYEEDDDDVAFNMGNDSAGQYEEAPAQAAPAVVSAPSHSNRHSAKEDGKMFIGGLNWETTDQSLRDYFSQFGEVTECTVMRDSATGRSRGFGFLTFRDPKTVNIVMVKEHFLDGKIIDPKRAIPRDEQEKTSKIFVGGVSQETTDQEFREYFAQFGRVVDATLMMDKDTGRPRGFGFVTFESEAGVDACLDTNLEIHGKPIEVKKAQPRGNLREDEDAQRRGNKFGRKGQQGVGMDDGSQGGMNAMGGGGQGNMTPQMFAQYMQRMQQAFTMMQQQMAMNRNMSGGMNPMMQMMQMQQMQQMQQMMAQAQAQGGRGGGGANPMGAMNPQMMQQMQQMMAQQGGAAAAGGASPVGAGNAGARQGFNGGFEQQQQQQPQAQQPFEQQKFDQRNRGGGYGGGAQQGYNPTSWEGMYDDVPQPMMNQGGGGGGGRGGYHPRGGRGGNFQARDPNQAPPANAPTGPKNAGKPGANYRGGGRGGGSRGFHPYGRG